MKKDLEDFTQEEIAQYEREHDAIVLFDGDYGIAFQKVDFEDQEEAALAVSVSVVDEAIILYNEYVQRLKDYLNRKF